MDISDKLKLIPDSPEFQARLSLWERIWEMVPPRWRLDRSKTWKNGELYDKSKERDIEGNKKAEL